MIQPRLPQIQISSFENFVHFGSIESKLLIAFKTQVELFENILSIYHQMHICLVNYKNRSLVGTLGIIFLVD